MATQDYIIGSVSSGTMKLEDLIPCFLDVLEMFDENNLLITAIYDRMEQDGYYESEDANYDLDALFYALQDYAPPYFYFGSRPGDGADFGFWLIDDVAQQIIDDGGLVVSDLGEIDADSILNDIGPNPIEVLHVNDHGNTTLYSYEPRTNKLTEIWAIV